VAIAPYRPASDTAAAPDRRTLELAIGRHHYRSVKAGRRGARRNLILIAVTALAVAGGVAAWRLRASPPAAAPAPPAIPVVSTEATVRDVPEFVSGLGTVQAFNTVAVKTRVDGQITSVFFTEGQDVKAGDQLFQIDPRPFQAALAQAEANQQKDQAQLQAAQLTLGRYGKLVGPGWQTQQSYDDQKATVGQLQAAVHADQAVIDNAKLNLDYALIRSPIDGRTGARQVDIGNLVQAGQGPTLVTITQLKPIFVSFTVPQEALDAILRNQAKAPLSVEAFAGDDKTLLSKGTLSLVDNQVDTTTGTIRLKATFANSDERLWPGEFVSAHLILSTRANAVTVPAPAVMHGPSGAYLYVIKPDNTVERRTLEVAATQDGLAVIAKGVSAGDRIVLDGQYRLTNGAKVAIAAPGRQPPGQQAAGEPQTEMAQ
jgi:multidrug efflux system membrane fusion protein